MNYFGIIKRAYHLTLKNRFLWLFGILAGGYGGVRTYNFSSHDLSGSGLENLNFDAIWSQYSAYFISIGAIVGLVFLILFVLSIISQGALVSSVAKISGGEKVDFSEGFHLGWSKFWRVLGVMVIFFLVILAALLLWITPTALFAATLPVAFAVIWGIIFFLVIIAFFILVGVISPYSLRVAILKKHSLTESISYSLRLCRENLVEVVVMYLILMAIGIAFGLGLVLAFVLIGALLLGIGVVAFLASSILGIIYSVIVGAVFVGAVIVLSGAYGAFTSAVITLTYQELLKKS